MHFPKKENTLSQHNNVDNLRPDAALTHTAGRQWDGEGTQWVERGVSVSLLTTAVECSMLSCCVCVCVSVCLRVCVCCVWWKCKVMMGASFNLPSAYRLPCGCSRRVSATVPPPPPSSSLSPPSPYLRCVCAYKSHKSVREVMSKQAVNMFV